MLGVLSRVGRRGKEGVGCKELRPNKLLGGKEGVCQVVIVTPYFY